MYIFIHFVWVYPAAVEIQSKGNVHTWICYNGRYYDSESPLGVTHPSNLPIFNRN